MAFHEVQFPKKMSWGSKSAAGYNTLVTTTDSGNEHRVARTENVQHSYDVSYGIKSYDDLAELKTFFMARGGALNGFRLSDPHDYNSNATNPSFEGGCMGSADQQIGTGDGTDTTFQLIKTYTSGPTAAVRTIRKPVAGTVTVYLNGALQSSGWSVDTTTGIVTFTSPPSVGVAVAASFEFDVPVRFGTDVDRALAASADSFSHGGVDSITLVEIVDPQPGNVTEYFYGGSYEIATIENITLSTGLGRLWVIAANATGLSATLPDPTNIPTGGVLFTVVNEGPNSIDLKSNTGTTLVTLATGECVNVLLSLTAASAKVWYAV